MRIALPVFLLSVILTAAVTSSAQEGTPPMTDLMKDVPQAFPRIVLEDHPRESELISHYLWYHFHNRLGNNPVAFNKEYLLTSDIWLGDATDTKLNRLIQDVHREHLLIMQPDAEGYFPCYQHFSNSHDWGWPFPVWNQSDADRNKVKGRTAGWHFQDIDHIFAWVQGSLRGWGATEYYGETATKLWELSNLRSLGIQKNRWVLEVTGPSPTMITPLGYEIDSFNAPFLQLRWKATLAPNPRQRPYIEWQRESDSTFSHERRMFFDPDKTPLSGEFYHSIIPVHSHPEWEGQIKRIRIVLAPGGCSLDKDGATQKYEVDSFFTVYDTRHTINNPIYIMACWEYFTWTGDLAFLRQVVDKMRVSLHYQQTKMGGLEYGHIRNSWPGHDGVPGWHKNPDGSKTMHAGHSIGSNYWDILPFGWDDFYATYQYYRATLVMADLEEAVAAHPEWNIPQGMTAFSEDSLREHATRVKETANKLFWNKKTGRFNACIDKDGDAHEYGFTFLNLDAIWYGIASDEHSKTIMDWLTGKRTVEGDTSTGEDIYHWRFGPRATTKRNEEWYFFAWTGPETIPWGGQVQDGGAVLGFSFYDLWARLQVIGPDDAWKRLCEILDWEDEVWKEGGYRPYYADGKRGATLQAGGTAGGLGIDAEFFESSLLPSIISRGFLGLEARSDALRIRPNLPKACPEMAIENVLYRNIRMDVRVSDKRIVVRLKDQPVDPIWLDLGSGWNLEGCQSTASRFSLDQVREYRFGR